MTTINKFILKYLLRWIALNNLNLNCQKGKNNKKEKNGKKERKVGLRLVGKKMGLMLNKTNAQLIAKQHGDDMESWVGKTITIYPTTTDFGGEQVDCIRVEQVIPEADPDDEIPF